MRHSTIVPVDQGLAAFDAANSPYGLLERYATGRITHFFSRQILTLGGALSLALLASPLHGLAAICMALLGEAVDCLTLRRVQDWRAAGRNLDQVMRITTATAIFQALTISACVMIPLIGAAPFEVTFFAITFLTGAAINAGLVMPFHPMATVARLSIYAVTCVLILAAEAANATLFEAEFWFNLLAVIMLLYMVKVFLRHVNHHHKCAVRERRDLLAAADALGRANTDLEDSQREARQLSLVARHANDSVVITGPDRAILWINNAFTDTTGYGTDDAIGRTPSDLLNGPNTNSDTVAGISAALKRGEPHRTEILNYTKSGQEIWVETNLVPLLGADGTTEVVIAIERNITQTKDDARQLAQAKLRAEDAVRAKAAFLATMSHEIRTPMNGIIGMADLLGDAGLTDQHREYVATIHDSAEALLKIINDILDYSRLEANKVTIDDTPFALSSCLRSAANLLRPQAREKGLFLDISHDTALPDHVTGDSGRLRQIILNLIGNAIKFTARGGITVRVSVKPDGGAHHLIDILVDDTGIGISPDRADQIFEQFEQADAQTTRKFGGTGLGLAISRQLARTMGGDLVLCPPKEVGSAFRLTVRVGRASQTIPPPEQKVTAPPAALTGLRLLVADDNQTNRQLIKLFLQAHDLHLYFAENGLEAVQSALTLSPDIILMDMSMPELDGLAATRRIRAADRDQPYIIALTANVFASDKADCFEAGMDDFLSKPLRKMQLIEALVRARDAISAQDKKPLGPAPSLRVSGDGPAKEARQWTSQPESGTTNGRSIRSSGL